MTSIMSPHNPKSTIIVDNKKINTNIKDLNRRKKKLPGSAKRKNTKNRKNHAETFEKIENNFPIKPFTALNCIIHPDCDNTNGFNLKTNPNTISRQPNLFVIRTEYNIKRYNAKTEEENSIIREKLAKYDELNSKR